jgi:hypothetical protein
MSGRGDSGPPERRYTDAEVSQLLKRAASLQGRAPTRRVPQGLTLGQLEEIAAEAQIDVARLREAARELDTGVLRPASLAARAAGAPFRINVEETLPFEINPHDLGALVHSISGFSGESGTSNLVGRTFVWDAHATSGRRVQVRISVGRGTTHVWVEERYGEIAGGVFAGVLGGFGGASIGVGASLGAAAGAVLLPVAVVAGGYLACRAGYRAYVLSRGRRVASLCERIVADLRALHDAAPVDAE